MNKYPLKLTYIAKTALWAGKRLKEEFGKKSDFDTVSETWELSVREDEMARVVGGEADGMSLAEYFEAAGYDCVTPSFKKGDRFPLLVKLIDANDVLSVQVHPDDEYAREVENDSGKTEMWYVVDAKDGAELVFGLKEGLDEGDFAKAIAENRIGDVMNYRKVKEGDTYFIPAGMLHAIGAGILIAEIQQNSDLTYRVYDFDRVGADGKLRPLHVDKALAVTRPYTEEQIEAIRYARSSREGIGELLADSEYFGVRKVSLDGEATLVADALSFLSVLCIDGQGSIIHGGVPYDVNKGDSYFIPAGMGEFTVRGKCTLIVSNV